MDAVVQRQEQMRNEFTLGAQRLLWIWTQVVRQQETNTAKHWEEGVYFWSLGQHVSGPEGWLLSRLLHGDSLTMWQIEDTSQVSMGPEQLCL